MDTSSRSLFVLRVACLLRRRKPKYRESLMIPPVGVVYTCPYSSSCETARSAFPTTQRPGSAAAPEKEDVLVANAYCSLRIVLIIPANHFMPWTKSAQLC